MIDKKVEHFRAISCKGVAPQVAIIVGLKWFHLNPSMLGMISVIILLYLELLELFLPQWTFANFIW